MFDYLTTGDFMDAVLVVIAAGIPDPYPVPDGTWNVTGSISAAVDLSAGGDISAVGDVGCGTLTVNSTTQVDGVLDEDDLASDSATSLATQQSIKAYVDTVATAQDALSELADTDIASEASGQIIVWDGSDSWDNKSVSGDITLAADGTVAIAAGAIVNADINASAAIVVSKLAYGTARQLLQTNASGDGVEWTDNIDVPGTLDVTGATVLDSTLTVVGVTELAAGAEGAPSLHFGNSDDGFWGTENNIFWSLNAQQTGRLNVEGAYFRTDIHPWDTTSQGLGNTSYRWKHGWFGNASNTAAALLHLYQNDIDEPFVDFRGTAAADAANPISTLTTSGATTHHVRVDINGANAWIAVSTTDPS